MKPPEKVLCLDDGQQNLHSFDHPLEFPNGQVEHGKVYHVTGVTPSGLRLFLLGFPVLNTSGEDIGFSHRRFKVLR